MDYYTERITSVGCMLVKDLLLLSIPWYLKAHRWNLEDEISSVYEAKKRHILSIIRRLEIEVEVNGESSFVPGHELETIDIDRIRLGTFEFYELVYEDMKQLNLVVPLELCELVGRADEGKKKKIHDQVIDKAVCQGIARTLWEKNPKLTIEQIKNSKEIQVFGNGAIYKDVKTLRNWISEVDMRTNKRGRKKKNNEEIAQS